MRRVRIASVCVALLLAAGCAATQKIDMTQDSLAGIRTVDLVLPPDPPFSVSWATQPVVTGYGLVGGAVSGIVTGTARAIQTNRVREALQPHHVAVSRAIADRLTQRLRAAGYRSRVIAGEWDHQTVPASVSIEAIRSDADALLVVAPTSAGFMAGGMISAYEPSVSAIATLRARDRTTVLYRGLHATGPGATFGEWHKVATRTTFADVDKLVENPAATASALTEAARDVADAIATDMETNVPRALAHRGT